MACSNQYLRSRRATGHYICHHWYLQYNAMLHDTTGYQPYELMFHCKAPTIGDAWLGLGNYNDNFLQSKCAWVNQQHELILAVNRWAFKRVKTGAEKSVSQAGGKALNIPVGNLVLLHDHQEGCNKIQDNYRNEMFVVKLKLQDPNAYMKPLNGKGPMCMVNRQQLFHLQKTQGSDMPSSPAPDTILSTLLVKKPTRCLTIPNMCIHMVPGPRPKQIPWYCSHLLRIRLKIHQYLSHPLRIQGTLESWVTCLTTFQLNYGGKEVAGTWFVHLYCTQKLSIFVVMWSHLYEYCKGQLWSWHAEAQHLRTDALG